MPSKIFIITGTSGAGKDSVIKKAEEKGLDFIWAKTTTSRPKRDGESEGNPYYFVSPKHFQEKIRNDELVEYAEVYGTYYGMEKKNIEKFFGMEKPIVVRVDIQGVATYKKTFPDSICIFIAAPNFKILEKRIRDRGQDSEKNIQIRMAKAREEMKDANTSPLYDFIVVNKEGELDETADKMAGIIKRQ